MAPVLQCPDCGAKHPLTAVPDTGTFPCTGCGRALKVPEVVPRSAGSNAPAVAPAAPPPSPVPDPPVAAAPATRAIPVAKRTVAPPGPGPVPTPVLGPTPSFAPVPLWMRFVLWVVAVPLSFVVIFLLARATGLFTSSQLSDVFLANAPGRFWPVIRILPFVALLTAGLVHGGVYALARRLGRRRGPDASGRGSYRSR